MFHASHGNALISGALIKEKTFAPGVGFTVADGTTFFSALALWGISDQTQTFTGADVDETKNIRSNTGKIGSSLGVNIGEAYLGLKGEKQIFTSYANDVYITTTMSNVELFLGGRF